MGDVTQMTVNALATVSSYGAMLNRIATLTFLVSLGFSALVRSQVSAIDRVLAHLSVEVSAGGLTLPLGTVGPAAAIAVLSRVFKLHDRISDLLKIRHRFDVNHILFPLALGSGASITVEKVGAIGAKRSALMGSLFYSYASSDPDKTVIDKHKVEMALDMWGWYWVFVEGNAVALLCAIIFLIAGSPGWGAATLIAILLSLWILQTIKTSCSKYALDEVAAILQDAERKANVAKRFNAL